MRSLPAGSSCKEHRTPPDAPADAAVRSLIQDAALVARQPIFNSALRVVAYELLYRAPGATTASFDNAAAATANVIVGAAIDIGLTQLVGDTRAFINFPRELLVHPPPLPMQPGRVVIEVLEDVEPDPEVMAGLALLRRQGYRIALDDHDLDAGDAAFLKAVDIVKVDLRRVPLAQLSECVLRLQSSGLQLIAEKVETWDEFALCKQLGFDAYQGYVLQRPQMVSAHRVPTNRIATMKLLLELYDPQVSVDQIEATIGKDVSISYRLLRCINSSYYHLSQPVNSVRQAILLIGFNDLRKLCTAIGLAGFDDQPGYVSVQAMVRAKMCEELCIAAELNACEAFFMTGLLSMIDVLLRQPLRDAVSMLPLGEHIRGALLEHAGPLGEALLCARRYEEGAFSDAAFMGLPGEVVSEIYRKAVGWADSAWRTTGGIA